MLWNVQQAKRKRSAAKYATKHLQIPSPGFPSELNKQKLKCKRGKVAQMYEKYLYSFIQIYISIYRQTYHISFVSVFSPLFTWTTTTTNWTHIKIEIDLAIELKLATTTTTTTITTTNGATWNWQLIGKKCSTVKLAYNNNNNNCKSKCKNMKNQKQKNNENIFVVILRV